jgi:hypothetical protein
MLKAGGVNFFLFVLFVFTNSQDTSDQQEASDKQKPIDVEKTKQKLADIDKRCLNLHLGFYRYI